MFSLVSGPFIVMFILATFDPDETNSLLIPKLFALLSRKSQVSLSNCPVVFESEKWPLFDCVCSTGIVVAQWSSSPFLVVLKLMANCSHYE